MLLKAMLTISALIVSSAASAQTSFKVPDGRYEGLGTWTSNNGASGTVRSSVDVSGRVWTETATYSDGHVVQVQVTFDDQGASTYNVSVAIDGVSYVIGNGACSQDTCASTVATPVSQYFEVSAYNRHGLLRSGALFEASIGFWRVYRIALARRN